MIAMESKKLVLEDTHLKLGGKMVPFAGFNMPVRYSSDKEEHLNVRSNVGVFDVSHMGEFMVKGTGALNLIQYVTTNDASKLIPGKVQYSCLPNENGGIVDDLLVYMIAENEYMLVVNASNIDKDWQWINSHNSFGASLENISDKLCLFAVQGPNAVRVMKKITSVEVESMEYYTFQRGNIGSVLGDAIVSATGYTGAGGFEVYVENKYANAVWQAIFEAGREFDIKPTGLGARDTLRLEMGYCLYGNDIDDTTSPIEAGLGWITKFDKAFINAANLKKQRENGVSQKLVGFMMEEKGIPRGGYPVADADGNAIGRVTSGTISPCLNTGVGLAYVPVELAKPGVTLYISIREKILPAKIVKLPIYKG